MMMRAAGRAVGMLGATAFIAVVALLPYEGSGAFGRTLWDLTTREPAIVTAIAAVVLILTAVAFRADSVALNALPACLSFYLCGQWFYAGSPNYTGLGIGFTLATIAAAAMAVGGLCTLTGLGIRPAPRTDTHLVTAGLVTPAPATTADGAPPAQPPPGWYPDPADGARERYWTGGAWTDHVRRSADHHA